MSRNALLKVSLQQREASSSVWRMTLAMIGVLFGAGGRGVPATARRPSRQPSRPQGRCVR